MKTPILNSLVVASLVLFRLLGSAFGQGVPLDSGLAAYWPMDDNFNSTVGGFTATGVGTPTRVPGKTGFGNAVQFNGTNQYLVVNGDANNFNFAGESMTVSAWFTADSISRSWQALTGKGDGANNWRLHRRGGDVPAEMSFCGGSADIPKHNTALTVGGATPKWHHVVGVSEVGVSVRLYMDGVLVSTGPAPTLNPTTTPLRIGDNAGATGRYWHGKVDDFALWNRALSVEEITQIYQGGLAGTSLATLIVPPDADGDGLPDAWETANMLDKNDNGLNPNNLGVPGDPNQGAAGDPDIDLSTNAQEFARRTNPRDNDSDNDTLLDGVETNTDLWVSLTNTGTDPLSPDSDGDGLSDSVENPTLPYDPAQPQTQPGTDPNKPDSDNDTYPDAIEITYGSNPTNAASLPNLPGGLPLVDDFNDNFRNPRYWTTNTAIPQGGASVTERNQRTEIVGRGYLNTAEEFDPAILGGIVVTGQWTFVTGDDFMQIILRSDGVPDPANCCGETRNGIEFNVSLTDAIKDLQIYTRNAGTITVNQDTTGILTAAGPGMTFDFEIADDGNGGLSFTMTQVGNPANTAFSTATITTDNFAQNFIAFHNREGGRTAYLDNVSVTRGPANVIDFTQVNFNKLTNQWTLTWTSKPSRTYRLNYSTDLLDFSNDIDDAIASGGATTTYGPFPNPIPLTGSRVYFKVTEN